MKLLIDANILLDVLQKREPYVHTSSHIWKMCEVGSVEGYVTSLTFANLVYVMRKDLNPEKIEEILCLLKLIFRLTDLTVADLTKAAEMKWPDFEDAVQSTIAERIHADYIITRNSRDFNESRIIAIAPDEYIASL